MLQDRSWFDVARFACRCVQDQSLGLRPWEKPPCIVSDNFADEPHNQRAAIKLLQKMLAAGVSRYDPNPITALKKTISQSANNCSPASSFGNSGCAAMRLWCDVGPRSNLPAASLDRGH
jgi:hypothetical protein